MAEHTLAEQFLETGTGNHTGKPNMWVLPEPLPGRSSWASPTQKEQDRRGGILREMESWKLWGPSRAEAGQAPP